jgi:ATP-dependent Clp protease ATP-binding subunit ClpC
MTFEHLKEQLELYYPALLVEDFISARSRAVLLRASFFVTLLLCIPVLALFFIEVPALLPFLPFLQSLILLFLPLTVLFALLSTFYNSFYFKDVVLIVHEPGILGEKAPITYETARIVHLTHESDVTAGLLLSPFGVFLTTRLGLTPSDVEGFLAARSTVITSEALQFEAGQVSAARYALTIFRADSHLADFLFARSIQEREFSGAVHWITRQRDKEKAARRFWGRDALGRTPSIGRTWSYGVTPSLKKFAEAIEQGIEESENHATAETNKLEAVLARSKSANALLVADMGSGEMTALYGLVGKIRSGRALPMLEGKQLYRLNGNALIDTYKDKASFEGALTKVMNESVRAGNIILVLDNLPSFVASARAIGSDVPSLLYPYLDSSSIQIIALSDRSRFHEEIETNSTLVNTFEVIRIETEDDTSLAAIIEDDVARVEAQTGLFFTFQALESVAQSATRYFTEGVPLDKARDLLVELPAVVARTGRRVVLKEDVLALVESKTGVPQEGVIKEAEKEKLLNLEAVLHKRVVGQDEAVKAIANAMRRARAGLRNPNRPIGSFLFLGPTGVGKTETAKALAEVFFGPAAPMIRLDMSEYKSDDALTRLIGSFEGGRAGTLASMLRDQKYGVLLLDEFEKSHPDVLNLFLQVLDEGTFSDMTGKKVNARNVIVIATSNAGSDAIFEMVRSGQKLEDAKDTIVNQLVESGQYRPELLNRFDGVILFHPLGGEQLPEIAKLLIGRLERRLVEQGIKLAVTDDLVEFVVKEGFDEKFGARPMNRILQEEIEKKLAEKMISGELAKGATVQFVKDASGTLIIEPVR